MRRPNVLILYTDQQRGDALGANGNTEIKTPNLDRLAREGVNFSRFFVQNPVCMPSRISFLTGQYPSALGHQHMGVPVPQDTLTLPRILKSAGYTTANIGKLHFLPHANRNWRDVYPDYGFDCRLISDEPGCYEDAYRAWVRRKAPDQLDNVSIGHSPAGREYRNIMRPKDDVHHGSEREQNGAVAFRGRSDVTSSAFVGDETIEYLKQRRPGEPFLCISGFYSPHAPFLAPREYLDLYDPQKLALPKFPAELEARRGEKFNDAMLRSARQGYYAAISEVDHYVGRILETLSERGLAENTLVVFTSDHGEFLGEHLLWGKGHPAPDCVARVPLIMRLPGQMAAGRNIDGLAEAVDVVPTLLDYCGIQTPDCVQGRSLMKATSGEAWPGRESVLMEHHGWRTLRTKRFKYRHHSNGQTDALYDLEKDPAEYQNVIADPEYAGALAAMRSELLTRVIAAEQPRRREWPY